LVEQRIENPRVPGSIPGRGTIILKPLSLLRGFVIYAAKKTSSGTKWYLKVVLNAI
jgi:hypothetical protein